MNAPFKPGPNFKSLTGKRFNHLLVHECIGRRGKYLVYRCTCVCGKEVTRVADELRKKCYKNHSCGCKRKRFTTHGHTKIGKIKKSYVTWHGMKDRCHNPKNPKFHLYGGKGVRVCERWLNYENFFADMGDPPTPKHSIDRIDFNGNYEPGNCRWASYIEQANNKSNNVVFEYSGGTLAQLSRQLNIPTSYISYHYKRNGTPIEKIVEKYRTKLEAPETWEECGEGLE